MIIEKTLNVSEKLIGASNGIICVQSGAGIRTIAIDEKLEDRITNKLQIKEMAKPSEQV